MTEPTKLTTKDVARACGLSEASIRTYRIRKTIPEPDGYIGVTPYWHWSTISRWQRTRPFRGRPSKVAS